MSLGVQSLLALMFCGALLSALLFWAQPGMVFYPIAGLSVTPREWGMDYEDVTLHTDDGVDLHGWFIPRPGARKVILFFHGNAGNISHRADSVSIFHRLGLNIFIFDYRGFGRSQGSISEQGLYRDARAAWKWLMVKKGFLPEEIILFGRSLGGVVAAKLASEVQPAGLILESSFSSARDAARAIFPLLSWIVLRRYEFNAAEYVKQAACPILVLHSRDDEILPYRLGRRLYDAAPQPKRFVELVGGHNDGFLLSQPAYEQAISAFVSSLSQDQDQNPRVLGP
jgi:fermentation-respiration switch protein FrsA (DUF1100 family)